MVVYRPRPGPDQLLSMYHSEAEISGYTSAFVESMLLPELYPPRRLPDDEMAASAIFKAPRYIENVPTSGFWDPATASTPPKGDSGESTILVFPGIFGAIWTSAESAFSAAENLDGTPYKASMVNHSSVDSSGTLWWSHGLRKGQTGFIPRQEVNGIPTLEVERTAGAGLVMRVSVRTDDGYTGRIPVRLRYSVAGVFTTIESPVDLLSGVGSLDFVTGVGPDELPSVINSIALGVDNDPEYPRNWIFSIADQGAWSVPQHSATHYTLLNIDTLSDLSLTSMKRTVASTMLLTYQGADLLNGGVIAAARLQKSHNLAEATSGNYYSYLMGFQTYKDDEHLKEGIYSPWVPDSIQEFFFTPYRNRYDCDDLENVSYLIASARRDNNTQTLRLHHVKNIEALTRSPQYAIEVPPYSPEFPRALQALKLLPAVTENHKHRKFFANAWDRIKKWFKSPENWRKLAQTAVPAIGRLLF